MPNKLWSGGVRPTYADVGGNPQSDRGHGIPQIDRNSSAEAKGSSAPEVVGGPVNTPADKTAIDPPAQSQRSNANAGERGQDYSGKVASAGEEGKGKRK